MHGLPLAELEVNCQQLGWFGTVSAEQALGKFELGVFASAGRSCVGNSWLRRAKMTSSNKMLD